ncbi:phosphonate metabolism transcriptional regulator PhnF [Tabrizicola fusiformis]|uniref:phosphonate metabolism transcriptional regulator PhnF n=1 Tax=Tabrizicola sp. SY72 TaxID=2741673 RepID=UPI0018853402|nr:phosphonate metabolism transcriptional regulator PhnF [Tabrizicola sp. SY72]
MSAPIPKQALWSEIADTLAADLARGAYRPGERLPSEAELARRFGVNRHTLRRALARLTAEGKLFPRRGAGVFVADHAMTDYPLGRRVRFSQAVSAAGQTATRRFSRIETRGADAEEAQNLALPPGTPVHVVEGVSLADTTPLAAFRSVFPAGRFPGLPARLGETGSITLALQAEGLTDYTRAQTRIVAKVAGAALAARLMLAEGAPVLRTRAVNVDGTGQPVEYGTTWFAGDRVALTVAP